MAGEYGEKIDRPPVEAGEPPVMVSGLSPSSAEFALVAGFVVAPVRDEAERDEQSW